VQRCHRPNGVKSLEANQLTIPMSMRTS
jgi:hypothetical protein